ncbi:MAG TPA: glycosyltransferase family 39 protein [Anaerolineae bacterium]|nr:glycosyltransferase family 39 protein [Anaerolineae bacterium]
MKASSPLRPLQLLLVSTLLLIFAAQTTLGSSSNSAALDEEYHLGAGYAYLRTGDPRLSTEHPPLINVWNALPLTFLDPKLPLESEAWQNAATDDFGDQFLWQANYDHAVPIILLGRLPILFLGLLLGAIIFRFANDLFGVNAALLALTLFAFDPNLIAQSRLSTTDLGLALTMTLALWRMWSWLEKPTRRNLIILGVVTGTALMTKFTGLLLAPMFVCIALLHPLKPVQTYGRGIVRRVLSLMLVGIISLLVIWIVYGFEIRGGLPAATYWQGLVKIYTEYSQGYPTFLFGQISRTGWWYYFPITFLLKTPLPTLLLCFIGVVLTLKQRMLRQTSVAWLPAALSMTAALFSPLAIGYRHILPILPFAIILAGQAANITFAKLNVRTGYQLRMAGSVILIGWIAIGTLSISPHHLSYFNELIGGPAKSDNVLVDSNLDWGQDLPALKDWMAHNKIDRVNLAYFGTALPAAYGINYWPMPAFLHFIIGPELDSYNPYTPEPGWYAISATSLRMGLVYREQDLYAFFHDKIPDARAGYSILLYKIEYPTDTPIDRSVIVGTPTYAFSPEQLGVTPGHRLVVKWADNPDAMIFAMNGSARYFLADRFSFSKDFHDALYSAGQIDHGTLNVDARSVVEAWLSQWQSDILHLTDRTVLNWPINFADKLELIGVHLKATEISPDGNVDLTTYWRVIGDLDPSLQMFVHVLDQHEKLVAQYDGWQTAIRGLEISDVIAQRIHISLPVDTSPGQYSLRLGLYNSDSSIRFSIRLPIGLARDQVVLPSITIR